MSLQRQSLGPVLPAVGCAGSAPCGSGADPSPERDLSSAVRCSWFGSQLCDTSGTDQLSHTHSVALLLTSMRSCQYVDHRQDRPYQAYVKALGKK